ncbi:MAG: thiamine phosphate synthase [Desulfuromonadales bacterium]|nr:thiamine phosphate synthase [Desulfuromonadales bacterium]
MPKSIDFSLYLITDRHQVAAGQSLVSAVDAALRGGVRAMQLREKDLPARELLPLAEELRVLTRRHHARLLINDRIDVALAVEADGVHLGEHSLPVATARKLLGPQRTIGVSTHSLADIAAATEGGADFVTFGPVFATPSKAAYGAPVGLAALRQACRQTALPVFALGGIKSGHRQVIAGTGAAGIALISAIIAAADPTTAARSFLA